MTTDINTTADIDREAINARLADLVPHARDSTDEQIARCLAVAYLRGMADQCHELAAEWKEIA